MLCSCKRKHSHNLWRNLNVNDHFAYVFILIIKHFLFFKWILHNIQSVYFTYQIVSFSSMWFANYNMQEHKRILLRNCRMIQDTYFEFPFVSCKYLTLLYIKSYSLASGMYISTTGCNFSYSVFNAVSIVVYKETKV